MGLAVALAVAACGGSSSSNNSTTHAANSTPASTNASATSVMVKTAHSSLGTILVGPNGKTLYLFALDKQGKSNCSGSCAQIWPPLTTNGKPGVSGGAMAADVGTITRADGTKQVTYKGHPLYYYAADTSPGKTTGQGINGFGAKWWVVAPSGATITKTASGGGSSSGGGGGGSSSGGGGGGWG